MKPIAWWIKLLLCNLCFDRPTLNPTSSAIIFFEFACLMTRVQQENEGGSAKSAKCLDLPVYALPGCRGVGS